MKKDNQIFKYSMIVFLASIIFLGCFLWLPLYLAGPDGLEQVLFDLTGNNEYEPTNNINYKGAIFPDYGFVGISNNYFSSWAVGLIGAVITFTIIFGLFKLITIKKSHDEVSSSSKVA